MTEKSGGDTHTGSEHLGGAIQTISLPGFSF